MPRKKELTARYAKKHVFFTDFTRSGPLGVLFVETARKLKLSEAVTVIVEFASDDRTFRLQGVIVSSRIASVEPHLAPGVQVEFPSSQNRPLQLVLDHAEGKVVDFKDRSSRRVPCEFEVMYRTDAGFVTEFAEDIGEGGTFIRTEHFYPVGTEVECKLKPPGFLLGVKLRGKVAWVKKSGDPRGLGVEFMFENDRQKKKVRDLVRKLIREQSRQLERQVEAFKKRGR